MRTTKTRPTAAYIDLDALAFNFHSTKQYIGSDIKIMAVVKADAYGHGAVECAKRLEAEGVDWFGVAIPEEGVELRQTGITSPILCLGSFWHGQEETLVNYGLTPVIYNGDQAGWLNSYFADKNETIDVHVKIDTGMGRVGVRHDEAASFAETLGKLRVTGLLTHFASAEDPAENNFTNLQIERFVRVVDEFRNTGHHPELIDLANSPGAIMHPEAPGNMVRLGGALYGLLDDILMPGSKSPELKPVLSLRSRIANIKQIPAGDSLGYGRTFIIKSDSLIALVPIGYADGYPRALSNRGRAVINDRFVPVVGRVSMDWTLVDVTGVPGVSIDDEVYLIGGGGQDQTSAADIAREAGTIGYEITCGISPRVPRVYLE